MEKLINGVIPSEKNSNNEIKNKTIVSASIIITRFSV